MKTANQDRGGKRLPPEPGEPNAFYTGRTVGWQPTCACYGEPQTVVETCPDCYGNGIALCPTCRGTGEVQLTGFLDGLSVCGACEGVGLLTAIDELEECYSCNGKGTIRRQFYKPEDLANWPTRPAIVLDPFAGSGTTLMVAEELGRWWVGFDISDKYLPQIRKRTAQRGLAGAFET